MSSLPMIFALVKKEWLSLFRDWHALALMFILPAAFIVVLSLGLEGLYYQQTGITLRVGYLDEDGSAASAAVLEHIGRTGIKLAKLGSLPGAAEPPRDLEATIAIPKGFGASADILSREGKGPLPIVMRAAKGLDLPYRLWLAAQLERSVARTVTTGMSEKLKDDLPALASTLDTMNGSQGWVEDRSAAVNAISPLQLNVPGWALFAMFMISMPLSSGLVRERREGLLARIRTTPVTKPALIMGKFIPYAIVNTIQFAVLLAFGLVVVPRMTSQPIVFSGSIGWLAILVVTVSLVCASLGVAIGSWSKSDDQAIALTAGIVIIAAALGGIMIPYFAMPAALQAFAKISPLYWAHSSAVSIMMGTTNPAEIAGALARLLAFAAVLLLVGGAGIQRAARQD